MEQKTKNYILRRQDAGEFPSLFGDPTEPVGTGDGGDAPGKSARTLHPASLPFPCQRTWPSTVVSLQVETGKGQRFHSLRRYVCVVAKVSTHTRIDGRRHGVCLCKHVGVYLNRETSQFKSLKEGK